ncbi:MAG: HEPN domain-containing protein [Deltaproteobacteria bacterium]|nr:HEPN domain-containing protein [Deltaproteobacteria bacterium]
MRPRTDPEVADWLRKSEQDRRAFDLLRDAALPDLVCFLSQQAAEKALKGLLHAAGRTPPWVHDLLALIEELRLAGIEAGALGADAAFLSPFAVVSRYPGFGETDAATAVRAAQAAKRILEFVERAFSGDSP